jgi:hypothetical protein
MPKFSATTAVLLALLALPALASAAPTATDIATPSGRVFVRVDVDHPSTLQVEGTASGGEGDVDLRCYTGNASVRLVEAVPVVNGAFASAPALDKTLLQTLGYPHRMCTLRAVPAGTVPVAPPGAQSEWQGPSIGWGAKKVYEVGDGFDPTPADAQWDYYYEQAQSRAFNDYDSAAGCGLCDTYVFAQGTDAPANAIWWGNAGLFRTPRDVPDRTAVKVDGINVYAGPSAHSSAVGNFIDNVGFPTVSVTDSVDPGSGDLTIHERSEFKACAPDPVLHPPTDTSCVSFADSGVALERDIHQGDDGLQVTIVDHWKSVDGQAHELDAMYEDTEHSENAMILGHEGRADFTWTGDGFQVYDAQSQVPLPNAAPATMLVKTDAATPDAGDDTNPFGAMTFGTVPTEITVFGLGGPGHKNGRWHTRYARTVPAGGEVVIAMAYSHELNLDAVQAKAQAAEAELAALIPPVGSSGAVADAAPPATAPASAPADPAPTVTAVALPKPISCVVPKLRGKRLAAAKRLLKRAHCSLGKVTRKHSDRVKPGRVVATRLKPGTRHRAGTRIRLTIAKKLAS